MILGCTHYPLIADLLGHELGPDVLLVSSAEETARDVAAELARTGAAAPPGAPAGHRFLTTGDADRFTALADLFLGHPVDEVVSVAVGVAS